ncbi:Uma2 family endonuclease [Nonomuraea typhae]|uniref:Uma2 family endonuclease n=1 Tax=Nonomuraea typhae TaxID=2603600 RepID=A0ABW7YN74_9ACTN
MYDLDALPEDGKNHELADGWLFELSHSVRHDHAAERLKDLLKRVAGAEMYIAGGSNDVATAAGVRKPDVIVMTRDAARATKERKARTIYGAEVLLAVEVVSPRSGSEQHDRVRKVREYAATGIPMYWIVDLEPSPTVAVMELDGDAYRLTRLAKAGEKLTGDFPFPFSFDPGTLTDLE